ncbi:MAG: hypothetical protein ACREQC_18070 [Candidatus Binataceae bacterium]
MTGKHPKTAAPSSNEQLIAAWKTPRGLRLEAQYARDNSYTNILPSTLETAADEIERLRAGLERILNLEPLNGRDIFDARGIARDVLRGEVETTSDEAG